ncbi:hypothetical protein LH407_03070 [Antiquaquibacter oligotrophicus]|nr:hypothetical protein [Antiquaquibacter oligotrophicus]UDF13853.1 hypothetical protein LH407_03070 [Antiquaquibacter oligotrophicus]
MGVAFEYGDEPWDASVEFVAGDGSIVYVGWDQFAEYVYIRWRDREDRAVLVRYKVVKLHVRELAVGAQVEVVSKSFELHGRLVIDIGEQVSLNDQLTTFPTT